MNVLILKSRVFFWTLAILPLAAVLAWSDETPNESPKDVERLLYGEWIGLGPCDGDLILLADGIKRQGHIWSIIVWRTPKTPGGHRLVMLTSEGHLIKYLKGR